MNSEKNELFELCENIILNDNLNEESIREIAEYINNTPNALDCWPANILIDPLKKVWEDGKIDRSEINSLQNTLEKIVNETNQTEIQDEKLKEDVGVEDLLDPNRSTEDQIAAIENIGFLQDHANQKYQKTDAERARGGCGFVIALIIISAAIMTGSIHIILGVLGFMILIYFLSKIGPGTGGLREGGGFRGGGGSGFGGCGGCGGGSGCGGGGGCGGGD